MLEPRVTESAGKTHPGTLSEVDWIVVDIARKDAPISLNPDRLWARISCNLFRLAVANPLADHRLEALRRFCVRAWYWNFIRASDLRTLIEAGYSHVQALQVLAHVAGRRGFCPTIEDKRRSMRLLGAGRRLPSVIFQYRARSARAFRSHSPEARAEPPDPERSLP